MTSRFYTILLVSVSVLVGCGKAEFKPSEDGQPGATAAQSDTKTDDASVPKAVPIDDPRAIKDDRHPVKSEPDGGVVAG